MEICLSNRKIIVNYDPILVITIIRWADRPPHGGGHKWILNGNHGQPLAEAFAAKRLDGVVAYFNDNMAKASVLSDHNRMKVRNP